MNRRQLISGALALALMPRKAYSFVGGWGMPAAFVELLDGSVRELECFQSKPITPAEWREDAKKLGLTWLDEVHYRFAAHDLSVIPVRTFELVRIVTPEAEAWFDNGILTETTWRDGRPIPTVHFPTVRTLHEQYSDPRRA